MKRVKQYILPLFTFLLIAAGAAMPFAVSWVQDNRISGLQEEFPLGTVNLKLQQEVGVGRGRYGSGSGTGSLRSAGFGYDRQDSRQGELGGADSSHWGGRQLRACLELLLDRRQAGFKN